MDKLTLVSACSYAGPPARDYETFVDSRYREEFERWASSCEVGQCHLPNQMVNEHPLYDEDYVERHLLPVSGRLAGLYDAGARIDEIDAQGVSAEVLFPDSRVGAQPPFNAVHGPVDARPELERAGIRAYNRWLADFCRLNPTRLVGVAVLPLGRTVDPTAIDDCLSEIEWAEGVGFRGVLLRTVAAASADNGLPRLGAADPSLEPIWDACEAFKLTVHTLGGTSGRPYGALPGGPLLYHFEWAQAANGLLGLFVLGGLLERHPHLRLILADQGTRRIVDLLDDWEMTFRSPTFDTAYYAMPQSPWVYWARQCLVSPAPLRRTDCDLRYVLGVQRMMWGSRYPEPLGGWLATKTDLGEVFARVPLREMRAILGMNAVRAYDLDAAALSAIAERVGPDVAEVQRDRSDGRRVLTSP